MVAVGASAGGLAAFTALLKALSPDSGMAFVIIQHLAPEHESALSLLLSKTTSMPVMEASNGLRVEANRVYVIPPNRIMTIRGGNLRLTPRTVAPHPIDDFFAALAEEQGNAAIGVLLSGTGSDGTNGLKAIKAAGGVSFVQDPKSAQWPAMPMSAIAAGAADFIMAPRHIAAELVRIGQHPYLRVAHSVEEGSDLDKVCLILRAALDIDFRMYKQATVQRRIARRMVLEKVATLAKYAEILKRSPEAARALADDIFIHVTKFFRDPECFQALKKRALAKLAAKKATPAAIRVWVAGCSTGEEVYSIAMMLLEELGEHASQCKVQIFGTDIQERAIEQARAGTYSEAQIAGVSRTRLKRFFVESEHGYQIRKSVRDLCVFARHDLACDPPFSRLDLVSCRNVLIYMGPALQKRALATFQYALKPGGWLFLGNSEAISRVGEGFTKVDAKHRIYLGQPSPGNHRAAAPLVNRLRPPDAAPGIPAPAACMDFRKEAEAVLLEHHAPPALIVDSDLRIVHFQGDTSPYLAPPTGQPSFSLLKMVRPELVVDLRAAIDKARRLGAAVHKDAVAFEHSGKPAAVRLEVRPLKRRTGKKQDLLVVFGRIEQREPQAGKPGGPKPARKKVERLEKELAAAREHLRTLIAEHDIAQEEMKAASEEVLSSNEELQSTNEELETAKEELQSSNEELITLNEELRHGNAALNVLTQDLTNLLVGVDIAVLVLDADLCVRRFTPVAGKLLNLIPGDLGRPFRDIASNLNVTDWAELLGGVMRHRKLAEREVSDREGRRYSMRIRPYRTSDAKVGGVLLVLFDIDVLHRALGEATGARDVALKAELRGDSILNSLTDHVAVLASNGTILAANDAWTRFAAENGANPLNSAIAGANYLEVCRRAASAGLDDAKAAVQGIEGILSGRLPAFQMEYPCDAPHEKRWFLMNVSPLKGAEKGVVVAHTNITARKLAELAARKAEQTIQGLLDSSSQSVVAIDKTGKIVVINERTEIMFGYTRDELLGQDMAILIPVHARKAHIQRRQAYFADPGQRPAGVGIETELRRKDGTGFPAELSLSWLDTAEGELAVAFVRDVTDRKKLEESAQQQAEKIRALADSLLTAQETEQRRVSRELHDGVCQQLASLAIDLGLLLAEAPEGSGPRLKALQARVVRASEEARHIAYHMHPTMLEDLGLVNSLRALCQEFSDEHPRIDLQLKTGTLTARLPLEVASCVFRVAQEGLRNVAKHSAAKQVSVALAVEKDAVALTIADDGAGFDPQSVSGRGGLGFIGAQERARLLDGTVTIAAKPGRGAQITLTIPLKGT